MVYQIKITLKRSKPPIWRRILVPADFRLRDLHKAIQKAMGWSDYHLHEFKVGSIYYGTPGEEFDEQTLSDARVRMAEVIPSKGFSFTYTYDFGDGWDHAVKVEKVIPEEAGARYPLCIAGERACPPEDSGGIWGYDEKLDIMSNPQHPDYEEISNWMGKDFDPDAFDIDCVNREFSRSFRRRKRQT